MKTKEKLRIALELYEKDERERQFTAPRSFPPPPSVGDLKNWEPTPKWKYVTRQYET